MDQDSTGKRRIDNGANGRDPEGRNGKRVKAVEHSSPGSSHPPYSLMQSTAFIYWW